VQSYFAEIQSIQFNRPSITRMLKYAGATLLYRVAGSSPAHYIPGTKYPELIDKGSSLVVGQPSDSIQHALNHLTGILRRTDLRIIHEFDFHKGRWYDGLPRREYIC
jgi:hypothetical protein